MERGQRLTISSNSSIVLQHASIFFISQLGVCKLPTRPELRGFHWHLQSTCVDWAQGSGVVSGRFPRFRKDQLKLSISGTPLGQLSRHCKQAGLGGFLGPGAREFKQMRASRVRWHRAEVPWSCLPVKRAWPCSRFPFGGRRRHQSTWGPRVSHPLAAMVDPTKDASMDVSNYRVWPSELVDALRWMHGRSGSALPMTLTLRSDKILLHARNRGPWLRYRRHGQLSSDWSSSAVAGGDEPRGLQIACARASGVTEPTPQVEPGG